MLNRAAVIVRPKKPYLDWAAGLDDSGLVPDPTSDQTVCLIPTYCLTCRYSGPAVALLSLIVW